MKKLFLILALMTFFGISSAHAYVADGNLTDWGISLTDPASKNLGYLNTHTPTGATVDFLPDDNAAYNTGSTNVGPGLAIGNRYDAEAMYFDNDANNLYVAVVTGVSKNESTYPAGDIFFDLGTFQDINSGTYSVNKYTFGVDILNSKFYTVDNNNTASVHYPQFGISNPWKIGSGSTYIGDVTFAYSGDQNSHFVLEAAIPLGYLGLTANPGAPIQDVWLHWTMECGNDALDLRATVNPVVPEPATMLLFGTGLVGVFLRKRRA
jgi:hypothetical protein